MIFAPPVLPMIFVTNRTDKDITNIYFKIEDYKSGDLRIKKIRSK
ncbi:hypothetical protein CSC2_31970 [Clostridium zeae]|uniref:Uncharacterized protein n=1 Tax=Clostridium zeae TaxID=2759022 RepID=A0ABQ1ED01_9CLOT|nr:hypothetical protein [Clostridium zeae]GFZ32671.1 hypothetical protein CSC2_31970 [Clostridium zeae]